MPERLLRDPRLTFFLGFLACTSGFTVDVGIPALPNLVSHFGVPAGHSHLMITAYLLAMGAAQVPLGYFSELHGRLPTLYLGLGLFVVGSLVSALATSFDSLLLGRFIQGFGAATGPVMARAIARDLASPAGLNRIMSMLVSVLAISAIAAPLIGSLLIGVWGWRAAFFAPAVFGMAALGMALSFVQETLPQRAARQPLLPLLWHFMGTYFGNRQTLLATLMLGGLFFGYMAFLVSFASVAFDLFAVQPQHIGFIFAVPLSVYLLSSWLCGRVDPGVCGTRGLGRGICFMVASAFCALALLAHPTSLPWMAACTLLYLAGMGFVFTKVTYLAMQPMPHIAGTASGLMGTTQTLFGTCGTLASALLYRGDAGSTALIMLAGALIIIAGYLALRHHLRTA